MRWLPGAVALCSGLAVASCALILDFDELQEGEADAGASGTGGSGGDASTACGDCDDSDPCTRDSCDTTGATPECRHDPVPLAFDDFDQTLEAEEVHRASLTAGGDRFYLSVYTTNQSRRDVSLASFGRDGNDVVNGPSFSGFAGLGRNPVSVASLTTDVQVGLDLHAYVAVGDANGPGQVGDVFHLVFDDQMQLRVGGLRRAALDANYHADTPQRRPISWKLASGEVYGAWIDPTGGIFLHTGTTPLQNGETPKFAGASNPAQVIAPAGTTTEPGVFWISDQPRVQLLSHLSSTALTECDTNPGGYLSATSANMQIPGFWLGAWTKVPQNSVHVEVTFFFCDAQGCDGQGPADCGDPPTPGFRNADFEVFRRSADPANRIHELVAAPFVDTAAQRGALQLEFVRIDFDTTGGNATTAEQLLEPLIIADMPLGPNGEGPDWPELAISGDDRMAVTWIEPNPSGADKLRIRRYRICK